MKVAISFYSEKKKSSAFQLHNIFEFLNYPHARRAFKAADKSLKSYKGVQDNSIEIFYRIQTIETLLCSLFFKQLGKSAIG